MHNVRKSRELTRSTRPILAAVAEPLSANLRMSHEWWSRHKVLAPIFPAGMEPLPLGWTEEDRAAIAQQKKLERFMTMGGESCLFKTVVSAGGGTGHLPLFI